MEFTCQMCQARLTTADIARQTLSVPTCAAKAIAVHLPLSTRHTRRCKPARRCTRRGVRCNCNACRIHAPDTLESALEVNGKVRVAWLRQRPLRRPAVPVSQGQSRRP